MSLARLRARVPQAEPLGSAVLLEHELRFHKRGRDGSGKCDACFVGDPNARMAGVLFRLPTAGKALLDEIEGLGRGYQEKTVAVLLPSGECRSAFTYYATEIDRSLKPYCWYRHHVLAGAREFGLPADYIDAIRRVGAVRDPDPERHAREYAIYRESPAPPTTIPSPT